MKVTADWQATVIGESFRDRQVQVKDESLVDFAEQIVGFYKK